MTAKARKKKAAPKASITKAKPRLPSSERGQVIPDLSMWNQAARIGGGITPQRISIIIREGDSGDCRRLIDLANECRQRDAHLQAVLSVSEESIAGLPWQIVPPVVGNREEARGRDKRAAAWVEEQIRDTASIQRVIADLAGAVFYGYSVVEIIWKRDGARLVPDRFIHVAPRRFRFRQIDGAFVQYDDGKQEILLKDEHPNKFIYSFPRVTGDIPQREGLCRVLVWMSVMRNWSLGDWLKTGEMSWKPWRVGTYNKDGTPGEPGASLEDIEDLKDVMRSQTTDFPAVIPNSTKIDINWPGGSNSGRSTHGELANILAQEMSKAVLGQTETTQASVSSGYAQAKVHDAVRKDLREARANQIAADITRDLIEPMIRLNFGDSVEVPRFEFITQDPVDLEAFSKALVNLRTAGVQVPQSWAHEEAGIPAPKDGEPLLGDGEEDSTDEGTTEPVTPSGKEPTEDEEPRRTRALGASYIVDVLQPRVIPFDTMLDESEMVTADSRRYRVRTITQTLHDRT